MLGTEASLLGRVGGTYHRRGGMGWGGVEAVIHPQPARIWWGTSGGIFLLVSSPSSPWRCSWGTFLLFGVVSVSWRLTRAAVQGLMGLGRPKVPSHSAPLECVLPGPWAQPGMSAPCHLPPPHQPLWLLPRPSGQKWLIQVVNEQTGAAAPCPPPLRLPSLSSPLPPVPTWHPVLSWRAHPSDCPLTPIQAQGQD